MGIGLQGLQGLRGPVSGYARPQPQGALGYGSPSFRAPTVSGGIPSGPGGLSQLGSALNFGKTGASIAGNTELAGDLGTANTSLGMARSAYNIANGKGTPQDYINVAKSGYQLGSQTGLIGGGIGGAGGSGLSAAEMGALNAQAGQALGGAGELALSPAAEGASGAAASSAGAEAGAGGGAGALGVIGAMYAAMQMGMGMEDRQTAAKERAMAEHGAQIANELYGSGFDPRRIDSSKLWSPDKSGYGAFNTDYLNSIGLGGRGYDDASLRDYLLWAAPNYKQNVSTLYNMNMQPYLQKRVQSDQYDIGG